MHIILCGMMGSGKTIVGRLLAQKAGRRWVDLDVYIAEQQQQSVSDIFAAQGEAAFRAMERQALKQLVVQEDLVLSLGGGTLCEEENRTLLQRYGRIVWLDISPAIAYERLKDSKSRPLLEGVNRMERIQKIYDQRVEQYRAAAQIIVDASKPPMQVVREILTECGE